MPLRQNKARGRCSAHILPDEIKIGAVLRKNEVIIPRSNFIFKKDDIVVLMAKRDLLPVVENMFRISSV